MLIKQIERHESFDFQSTQREEPKCIRLTIWKYLRNLKLSTGEGLLTVAPIDKYIAF